jgi:minor histocompatibility antigen H13
LVPGIFVALALRFDVSRGIKNRYFNSAFLGYTLGLTVTIIVMNWFQAAQVSSLLRFTAFFVPYFCHL